MAGIYRERWKVDIQQGPGCGRPHCHTTDAHAHLPVAMKVVISVWNMPYYEYEIWYGLYHHTEIGSMCYITILTWLSTHIHYRYNICNNFYAVVMISMLLYTFFHCDIVIMICYVLYHFTYIVNICVKIICIMIMYTGLWFYLSYGYKTTNNYTRTQMCTNMGQWTQQCYNCIPTLSIMNSCAYIWYY